MQTALPEGLSTRHLYEVAKQQAVSIGICSEDAQDCAQEFLIRILNQYSATLRKKYAQDLFPFWLRRCARNHALNFLRKMRQDYRVEARFGDPVEADLSTFQDPAPTPEHQVLRAEFWQQIHGALAQMTSAQQAVFVRYYLEEEQVTDIAASLGQQPNTTYQLLFRARERLRFLLEDEGYTAAVLSTYLRAVPPGLPAGFKKERA